MRIGSNIRSRRSSNRIIIINSSSSSSQKHSSSLVEPMGGVAIPQRVARDVAVAGGAAGGGAVRACATTVTTKVAYMSVAVPILTRHSLQPSHTTIDG